MRDTEGPENILQKDMDFQHLYLSILFVIAKEASSQGLMHEFEDIVDTLYCLFPIKLKKNLMIYDADEKVTNSCKVEWDKANKIGPPIGDERLDGPKEESTPLKLELRQRCLRKLQITSCIAKELKLNGEEFDHEEMGENSDVYQTVMKRNGST